MRRSYQRGGASTDDDDHTISQPQTPKRTTKQRDDFTANTTVSTTHDSSGVASIGGRSEPPLKTAPLSKPPAISSGQFARVSPPALRTKKMGKTPQTRSKSEPIHKKDPLAKKGRLPAVKSGPLELAVSMVAPNATLKRQDMKGAVRSAAHGGNAMYADVYGDKKKAAERSVPTEYESVDNSDRTGMRTTTASTPGAYPIQDGEIEEEYDEEYNLDPARVSFTEAQRGQKEGPPLLTATRVEENAQASTNTENFANNTEILSAEVVDPKGFLKRRWFWGVICSVLLLVAGGTTLGVLFGRSGPSPPGSSTILTLSPTHAPSMEIITGPPSNSPTEEERCSLCFGGKETTFSLSQLGQALIAFSGMSRTCSAFMETHTAIPISDPNCERGQALSWKYCGCPSLPTVPASSCDMCLRRSQPKNQSDYCLDQNEYVSIVGSWMPEMCQSLKDESSLACDCPTESDLRLSDFESIVTPVVVNASVFRHTTSPQYEALRWLAFEDPLALDVSDPELETTIQERFVIVVVYFSTGGPRWDRDDFGFLSASSVCDWYVGDRANISSFTGVFCDFVGGEISVSQLYLDNNNLVGTIPPEIGFLTSLALLSLEENALTGTIPKSFGGLNSTVLINLAENSLTGTLLDELFLLASIQGLFLNENQFSGEIPASLESADALVALVLGDNMLTGTVPSSVTRLSSLQLLNLYSNMLDGPIPEFSPLSVTQSVYFTDNALTGTIPDSLTETNALRVFDVSLNLLTGTLPKFDPEFGSLTWFGAYANELTGEISSLFETAARSLNLLWLNANLLEGSIPTAIGKFRVLETLRLYDNMLTGTLPSEIGNLALTELRLDNNTLTGSIPTEIGMLSDLETLHLDQNDFSGDLPSEIGSIGSPLSVFIVSGNSLSGTLPTELERLVDLKALDVSFNQFTGFPSVLERMSSLLGVLIAGNNFENVTSICENAVFQTNFLYSFAAFVCDDETAPVCSCCNNCCEGGSCSSHLGYILALAIFF